MKGKQINIDKLRTIKNYAMREQVTPAYIYKLVKENKMESINIDGVAFIDVEAYPVLPIKRR